MIDLSKVKLGVMPMIVERTKRLTNYAKERREADSRMTDRNEQRILSLIHI